MIQWLWATIAVVALVLLAARGMRAVLARSSNANSFGAELAQWRVAPDLRLRALRVAEQVHIVAETRNGLSILESLELEDYLAKLALKAESPARQWGLQPPQLLGGNLRGLNGILALFGMRHRSVPSDGSQLTRI